VALATCMSFSKVCFLDLVTITNQDLEAADEDVTFPFQTDSNQPYQIAPAHHFLTSKFVPGSCACMYTLRVVAGGQASV
jgi:hypothetical protein